MQKIENVPFYYKFLDLPVDASIEQIKKRYNSIITVLNSETTSEWLDFEDRKLLEEVVATYQKIFEILGNDSNRQEYDAYNAIGSCALSTEQIRLIHSTGLLLSRYNHHVNLKKLNQQEYSLTSRADIANTWPLPTDIMQYIFSWISPSSYFNVALVSHLSRRLLPVSFLISYCRQVNQVRVASAAPGKPLELFELRQHWPLDDLMLWQYLHLRGELTLSETKKAFWLQLCDALKGKNSFLHNVNLREIYVYRRLKNSLTGPNLKVLMTLLGPPPASSKSLRDPSAICLYTYLYMCSSNLVIQKRALDLFEHLMRSHLSAQTVSSLVRADQWQPLLEKLKGVKVNAGAVLPTKSSLLYLYSDFTAGICFIEKKIAENPTATLELDTFFSAFNMTARRLLLSFPKEIFWGYCEHLIKTAQDNELRASFHEAVLAQLSALNLEQQQHYLSCLVNLSNDKSLIKDRKKRKLKQLSLLPTQTMIAITNAVAQSNLADIDKSILLTHLLLDYKTVLEANPIVFSLIGTNSNTTTAISDWSSCVMKNLLSYDVQQLLNQNEPAKQLTLLSIAIAILCLNGENGRRVAIIVQEAIKQKKPNLMLDHLVLSQLDSRCWLVIDELVTHYGLNSINLNGSKLSALNVRTLPSFCKMLSNPHLSWVDLSDNDLSKFGDAAFELLCNTLAKGNASWLRLSKTNLTAFSVKKYQALYALLARAKKLNHVDLSSNIDRDFNVSHWQMLHAALLQNPQLTYLDLAHSNLGNLDRARKLAFCQILTIPHLRKLSLSCNSLAQFDSETWQLFCKLLAASSLSLLDLTGNDWYLLPIEHWQLFCTALANSKLTSVDLRMSYLSQNNSTVCQILSDALQDNYTLEILGLSEERYLPDALASVLRRNCLLNSACYQAQDLLEQPIKHNAQLTNVIHMLNQAITLLVGITTPNANKRRAQLQSYLDNLNWSYAQSLMTKTAETCDSQEHNSKSAIEALEAISAQSSQYQLARHALFRLTCETTKSDSACAVFFQALAYLIDTDNTLLFGTKEQQTIFDAHLFAAINNGQKAEQVAFTHQQRLALLKYVVLQNVSQPSSSTVSYFFAANQDMSNRLARITLDPAKLEDNDLERITALWHEATCQPIVGALGNWAKIFLAHEDKDEHLLIQAKP